MQTVHSFGRLQNLIGYDLDHDGQVKYMGTDLSEDDIKEIREDLEHDFSPEMMENIIDDLNQDQKELKSLLMPATLEKQELQLNAMEKSKKGWRGVVMKVLANKEAKENFEQQKEGLRAAIEDSRSRFMRKSHDLDQDQSPSNSADKLKDMGSAFGATPAEQEKPAARKLPAFIGHSAKPNKP